MRRLVLSTLILAASIAPAQVPANLSKSPNQVVAEFFQFEANGGRLTTDGWHKADDFFVYPVPRPQSQTIFVVDNHYSLDDPLAKITADTARVTVYVLPVGEIDSAFRFKLSEQYKGYWIYHLIWTDTHWRIDSEGQRVEMKGSPEWKINDADPLMKATLPQLTLTVTTAIRYVTEMRDKATDPAIKKNADETLAKLLKLH